MSEQNRENIPLPGEEITDWYIPLRKEPQEVTACYVHTEPLPVHISPTQCEEQKKKLPRVLLRVCLSLVALAIFVYFVTGLIHYANVRRSPAVLYGDNAASNRIERGLEDSSSEPSSIFNVFNRTTAPRIPRAEPPESVRLTISRRGKELTPQEIYEKVSPATVIVLAKQDSLASVGTGVIMTEDGYIITNAHVIAAGESSSIMLYGSYLYEAELVGCDMDTDIAVLKAINAENFPTAEFGDSDLCRVGDTVYAIGNPLGVELYGTMSEGILSAINRRVESGGHELTALQTTAALNNGNSGGPLINTAGQVVGITTMKFGNADADSSALVEGLGFALPISDVRHVVNDILATGDYHGAPTFGITVTLRKDADGNDSVVISAVDKGGAAEEAGLCENDVILTADGKKITDIDDLLAVRRPHAVGDTVQFKIRRGEETLTYDVKLRAAK